MNSKAVGVVSFSKDVVQLFCAGDIEQMNVYGVLLNKFEWLSKPANARLVYAYVSGQRNPRMPLGGPYWSEEKMNLFLQWMNGGYQP